MDFDLGVDDEFFVLEGMLYFYLYICIYICVLDLWIFFGIVYLLVEVYCFFYEFEFIFVYGRVKVYV